MTFSIHRNICYYFKSYKAGQNMANKAVSQQWPNTENVRENSIFLAQIETYMKWPQPSFAATVCHVWRVIRAHDTGSTVTVTWRFVFNSARPSTHHKQLSFNHFHQGPVHQAHLTHTKLPKLCHYRQIGGRRVTNPKYHPDGLMIKKQPRQMTGLYVITHSTELGKTRHHGHQW